MINNIDRGNSDISQEFETDGNFLLIFLGSLIMPDCDDYSDLEGFNKKFSEFAEKKKTYNIQKKIKFGKDIEQ